MKILILHGLDSVAAARRTSLHHAFFLPRHAPGHDYWLQAAGAPVTEQLRREPFDAVIIETTFLCWRWGKPADVYFAPLKAKYDFLKHSSAVKIAFPQDEYDHSAVLDAWLDDWRVDVVYSVCHDDRATFYPRMLARSEIRRGFTGLHEPADRALASRFALPWRDRPIDVGYRARRLPPCFGWFGALKSDIADRFSAVATGRRLTLDISCEPRDTFAGDDWLKFLGTCRFILGCESGSSLLDPVGDIKGCCDTYLQKRPAARFADVEAACFPGLDRKKPFSAISPRLFEAAAAGCAQILVPGDYAGALKPWTHYIPLEADASNIDEVIAAMRDADRSEAMVRASQEALLENPRFGYAAYAADVMAAITARRPELSAATGADALDATLTLVLRTSERWAGAVTAATPTTPVARSAARLLARVENDSHRAGAVIRRVSQLAIESWRSRSMAPFIAAASRRAHRLRQTGVH